MGHQIDNITEDTTCFLCEGKLKPLPNNIDSEKQRIIDYYPNWYFCIDCGRRFIDKSVPNEVA